MSGLELRPRHAEPAGIPTVTYRVLFTGFAATTTRIRTVIGCT